MPFMVVLTGEEASPGDVSHLVSLCRKLGIWVHLTARQASARVLGDLTHSTLTKQYGESESMAGINLVSYVYIVRFDE